MNNSSVSRHFDRSRTTALVYHCSAYLMERSITEVGELGGRTKQEEPRGYRNTHSQHSGHVIEHRGSTQGSQVTKGVERELPADQIISHSARI